MMKLETIRMWGAYFFRPLLYLFIGGGITVMLFNFIVAADDNSWMVLGIPMILITLFITIIGVVNIWLQYRAWRDDGRIRIYTWHELLWLYLRCFFVVVAGLSLSVVFYLMVDLLPHHIAHLASSWSAVFYILCATLTITAVSSIIRGEDLQEIRLRNAQNENLLLKSQLNPHFLYNTLNNIDALIWIDPEKASDAVIKLSELMRYLTYSARQSLVTVGEEVEQLRQLVDLQMLRMSKPGALILETKICDDGRLIAPLLLMPLVENTFKHCGSVQELNAIVLRLETTPEQLYFITENNLPASETDSLYSHQKSVSRNRQGGLGQKVLRRRLQLLYPNRFTFTSTRTPSGRYRTELVIRWGEE